MSAPFDTITTNKFFGAGMRKLTTGWAGNCFLCRRSSDNTTQNIGFSGNDVDVAGFNAFVGAGNGFVVTLYDQSGNGNDLTQGTAANQPQIILSATPAGKPVMRFNGTSMFLLNGAVMVPSTQANLTACMVVAPQYNADNDGIMVFDDTTGSGHSDFNRGWVVVMETTTSGIQVGSGVKNGGTFSSAQINESATTYQQLSAWYIDLAALQAENGVAVNSGTAQTTITSSANQLIQTSQMALGCRIINGNSYTNFGQVDIAEVAIWGADNSAAGTRGPVESDQTSYYLSAPIVPSLPRNRSRAYMAMVTR